MSARTRINMLDDAIGRYLSRNLIKTADISIRADRTSTPIVWTVAVDGIDVADCVGRPMLLDYLERATLPPTWWQQPAIRWERRRKTTTRKTVTVEACVSVDGYLYAASIGRLLRGHPGGGEEDGAEVVTLTRVPLGTAEKLARQGCSDQHYPDGYEAWQVALPYWHETKGWRKT